MLARGALCRLGVSQTSARDLPQLARALPRTLLSRNASSLPALRALSRACTAALEARRSYATTTTATKPTATVKRAVKAQAAEKAPPKKKATTKTAAKTTKTAKTAKAAKTVKKPRAAAKAKPKAKKTVKKAVPKRKRVSKVLTPEQAEKANIKKERAKLNELRKAALREPFVATPLSAYNAYIMDKGPSKGDGSTNVRLTETAHKWKSLTPAEHEVSPQITHYVLSRLLC